MTAPAQKARIAFTFETAGDPTPTLPILALLFENDLRATFFVDGRWGEANPHLIQLIADQGHEFGNHGYHHPDWTTLTAPEIVADLEATETLVQNLTGRTTLPWARPPYGAFDSRVVEILRGAGYYVVYRDAIDGGHWPGDTTVETIRRRVRQSITAGAVIVFHTNCPDTPKALPMIFDDLKKAGFFIGTLGALEEIPSSRQARYPDFAHLEIAPGYIRPKTAGRWQSINLFEYGAMAKKETNFLERIAEIGGTGLDLVTGDQQNPLPWVFAPVDIYVLVLVGELRCEFRDRSDAELGYLVARAGDLVRCPADTAYRLGPTVGAGLRWIAAIWRPTD